MRIAIEAQRIFRPNKHGMDFVILETLRQLQQRNDGNEYFVLVAPGKDRCLKESPNLSIIELWCPSYPLWEQVALPLAVKHLEVDVLHCTSNTAPLWSPVPLILTLHDIIYLEPIGYQNPSLYQRLGRYYRRFIVPRILHKCKKIITVSQFERKHIQETLHLPDKQITAVYNGYNTHFHRLSEIDQELVQHYIPTTDFLLFLGNTDPKKNTVRVLRAYSLYLKKSTVKRPLLIADLTEDYIENLLRQENITEIKPYLYYPGYIDNSALITLYNAAFAFLYPSVRESFGIPILEAMACGTPVIAGNTSAMPEITGREGLLVNPVDPYSITNALLRLETDGEYYNEQICYGLERVKLFSWEQTAQKYAEIYKDVIISSIYDKRNRKKKKKKDRFPKLAPEIGFSYESNEYTEKIYYQKKRKEIQKEYAVTTKEEKITNTNNWVEND